MTAQAADVRTLVAKWRGECQAAECERDSRAIAAGETIKYGNERGAIAHAGCPDPDPGRVAARQAAKPARPGRRSRRYHYSGRPGTGPWLSERCGCEDYPCCGH